MAVKPRKRAVAIASSEEALAFIQRMQKEFPGRTRTDEDRQRLQEYLAKFEAEELRGVARRVIIDIMKRPARTVTGARPPRRKPTQT